MNSNFESCSKWDFALSINIKYSISEVMISYMEAYTGSDSMLYLYGKEALICKSFIYILSHRLYIEHTKSYIQVSRLYRGINELVS